MSSDEDQRSYEMYVDPAQRPRRTRSTVRVIMVNEADQTLLFHDSDPGLPDFRWWVTPGGGIDPGESEEQAALREVAEETGLVLDPAALVGPVARRHVVHGYSDQVIEQDEAFYVAHVSAFEVDISAHTEDERLTLQANRWWDLDDLRTTSEWIWPAELLELWDLRDRPETWPVDLGQQEESTLPDAPRRDVQETDDSGSGGQVEPPRFE